MKGIFAQRAATGLAEDARSTLNPLFVGALNDSLRQQLAVSTRSQPAARQGSDSSGLAELGETADNVIEEMLTVDVVDRRSLNHKLTGLFQRLSEVYQTATIPEALRKRQYISRHGLVISPDNCITSVLDVLRVRAFVRGIDRALAQLGSQFSGAPLRVAYPACGPFAPLLLPLISYYRRQGTYSAADVKITLIDMQPGAVSSLRALAGAFEIEDFIDDILCMDAVDYVPDRPLHLVVLEAMQHGFSREAHFTLARHFAGLLAPGGLLLPQSVSVRAVLNSGQREYVDQWRSADYCEFAGLDPVIQAERIELGEILCVTAQMLRDTPIKSLDDNTRLLECGSVCIPQLKTSVGKQLLLLCSTVSVFDDETVNEYDSGITHPLPDDQVCVDFAPTQPRAGDLLVRSGDSLRFYYRLNGLPGFFAIKE